MKPPIMLLPAASLMQDLKTASETSVVPSTAPEKMPRHRLRESRKTCSPLPFSEPFNFVTMRENESQMRRSFWDLKKRRVRQLPPERWTFLYADTPQELAAVHGEIEEHLQAAGLDWSTILIKEPPHLPVVMCINGEILLHLYLVRSEDGARRVLIQRRAEFYTIADFKVCPTYRRVLRLLQSVSKGRAPLVPLRFVGWK